MTRPDELARRLDAIVDELDDLSFELLHDAAASGAGERPAADRTVAQARRAVEKAAALLRSIG